MALPIAAILAGVGRGIVGAAPKIAQGASRTAAFTETAGNATGRMITRAAVSSDGDKPAPSPKPVQAAAPEDLSQSVAKVAEFQVGRGYGG
jgi:hypothetical protein